MASTQANAAQPVRVCAAHPSLMHAMNGVLPVVSFLFCAVASIVPPVVPPHRRFALALTLFAAYLPT
ncbi:hypothetical protein C7410_11239 [Paraburkholderia silvatlantica]|uniref:Uncharacterized protein n=1 Tax=Paraburkholderia silvatlantica TaxID=321895 RepID=A0A2V4U0T1_9BURK|nr:hypothetical protein C7410_11239 [Paraburkholderia silvatlantica]TDQ99258.1 hypothetical protein C7412_10339 [Paraburkholderia silvatlantica]